MAPDTRYISNGGQWRPRHPIHYQRGAMAPHTPCLPLNSSKGPQGTQVHCPRALEVSSTLATGSLPLRAAIENSAWSGKPLAGLPVLALLVHMGPPPRMLGARRKTGTQRMSNGSCGKPLGCLPLGGSALLGCGCGGLLVANAFPGGVYISNGGSTLATWVLHLQRELHWRPGPTLAA